MKHYVHVYSVGDPGDEDWAASAEAFRPKGGRAAAIARREFYQKSNPSGRSVLLAIDDILLRRLATDGANGVEVIE